MYIMIDNYDSFTYNIVQYLSELTEERIAVYRNDEITVEEIRKLDPSGIIISPGPGRPEGAGISLEAIRKLGAEYPILGVCLGHQSIGQVFGGKVVQADRIMHGMTDTVMHDGKGLFRNIPQNLTVTRYHSLCVEEESLPACLEITARSSDNQIMGLRHRELLIEGVQFHPESISSEHGKKIFQNFLTYRRDPYPVTKTLMTVMGGKDLSFSEAAQFMDELTEGNLDDAQIASFLTALNMKGFTEHEIAGCASILRKKCVPLHHEKPMLDTCGTGGDGLGTFNISSYVALVCASCGVEVAKHGNRAISSKSGSADFYEALGININLSPEQAEQLLDDTSFTFMFAPRYHGAMRFAGPVRRSLKLKTIMNVLGPLANPASSEYQIIGVYDRTLLKKVARAAKLLGVKRVMTVHGSGGEDEISTSGPTELFMIDEMGIEESMVITPGDFGLQAYDGAEIKGGTAPENVSVANEIEKHAAVLSAVLLNSGAALYTAKRVETIAEGIRMAEEAVRNGDVEQKITEVVERSRRFGK